MRNANRLLIEGLSDAIGFVGGALVGFWLGTLLGWDLFAPGYGTTTVLAIALVGLSAGLGLQAARRWRSLRNPQKTDEK